MKGATGILARVLLPLMMIAVGGCEAPESRHLLRQELDPNLPTLDRIRRTESPETHAAIMPAPIVRVLTAHVVHAEFPADDSLDAAWSVVDENVAAPVIVQAWRANGLRVGILEEASLEAFTQNLPPALTTRRGQVATERDDPSALHRSPPLTQPLTVDVTVPPLAPRHETIARGHVQILAKLSREDSPGAIMLAELMPHHHLERTTLLRQRQPHEKLLDGRIFEELTLPLTLQPTDRVVIGLYRKLTEPDMGVTEETEESEDKEEADEAEDDAAVDDLETVLPWDMGRQLLTGRRMQRHVQVLLVISFEPPPQDVKSE